MPCRYFLMASSIAKLCDEAGRKGMNGLLKQT